MLASKLITSLAAKMKLPNAGSDEPKSATDASLRSNKRRRKTVPTTEHDQPRKQQKKNSDDSKIEEENNGTLDPSKLKWKSVTFPERVGDLEGLFGFEEIEGVDVEYTNVGGGERIVKFKKAKTTEVTSNTTTDDADTDSDADGGTTLSRKERKKAAAKQYKRDKQKERKKARAAAARLAKAEAVGNKFAALDVEDKEISLPGWTSVYPLSEPLLHALSELGFSSPTEIQAQAIPLIMEGSDIIGKASTGSGKTLAFGLPILEKSLSSAIASDATRTSLTFATAPAPTALIFAPTRELVHQISEHITKASKFTSVNIVSITGGLAIQKQKRQLGYFPNVIVATPGRMHELLTMDTDGLLSWMAKTEVLVLDEADRLLQDGHFKELNEILDMIGSSDAASGDEEDDDDGDVEESDKKTKATTKQTKRKAQRQTLVFSATFERDLTRKLVTANLHAKSSSKGKKRRVFTNANIEGEQDTMAYLLTKLKFHEQSLKYIDANPDDAVKREVVEAMIMCETFDKDVYLYHFLLKYPGRTIVFVNSIDTVKRLARLLQELELPAIAFHSHMIQKQRLRTIERFKSNTSSILISTDVAARGLDIPSVQHVIHYHLPRSADMYIHRSGRTARGASERGVALTLLARGDFSQLKTMTQKLGKNVKDLKKFEVSLSVMKQLTDRVELAREIISDETQAQQSSKSGDGGGKRQRTAKSGGGGDSLLLRQGAEDLGLDTADVDDILAGSDSDNNDDASTKKNTTAAQNDKRKDDSKLNIQEMRRDLRVMISRPVIGGSVGSQNYITSGVVNLAQQIVDGNSHASILGDKKSTALDDMSKSRKHTRVL
ncbi:P-loop containing nucleoside triphosphate hydrolase protein [Limtongia smithiae]|uniref:P-loop containing nucleoside triphosphate hydrolase protein n=1 Tax=Limtongia smithiae TaxID=1125753 RepID=UPI0034CFDE77